MKVTELLKQAAIAEAKHNHHNASQIVREKLQQFLAALDKGTVECESFSEDSEGIVFRFSDGFKVGWRIRR